MEFIEQIGRKEEWVLISHCSDCNLPIPIKWKSFRRQKSMTRCHACRGLRVSSKTSQTMKSLWQTTDFQERAKIGRVCSLHNEEERRRKISESMRVRFKNQAFRDAHSFAVEKAMRKRRKKISKAMKRKWQDPVFRAKVTESQRKNADELWGFKIDLKRTLNKLG